jgi:hypothetical protein
MTLDLVIVGLLAIFRPGGIVFHWNTFLGELTGLKLNKRFFAAVGVWLIVALPITYAMLSVQKIGMTELGTEFTGIDGKKTILIDPEKWIGKEFPLLPYIEPVEVREKLKTGQWTVVLYDHDCPKCKKVIDELIEKKTKNLVCVEVPPYGKERWKHADFEHARFVVSQKLQVETPVVIDLNDAFVRE